MPSEYEVEVAVPYRLDLTVRVLRRISTNIVDVITPEGQYVRAFGSFRTSIAPPETSLGYGRWRSAWPE